MDLPKHRGRRPHNALSAAFVRTAKPGYYCDGNGLYLRVDRSGARRWEQRLRIQGRNRTLGLGGCQLVSLAEAREKAFTNRKIARSGGDPRTERHKVRDMPTFAEAAGPRSGTEAARLAQRQASGGLDLQPARLCVPGARPSAGRRDNDSRHSGGSDADLARQARDRPTGAPAHRGGDEVGGGYGTSTGQPRRRRARSSAWPAPGCRPTHESIASLGGRGRDRGGADFGGGPRDQARLRVHGADGVPFRRGSLGGLG